MLSSTQERVFLASNDAVDAEIAKQIIENNVEAIDGIVYGFSIEIGDKDWAAAHAVGLARTAIAKARGRNGAQYRRGDDDERIDTEGALAELVAFGVLGRAADYCAPLVEYKPDRKGSDIGLGGKKFDVKSVSQSKGRCCFNRAGHFEKKPDAYIVIKLTSERVVDVYTVAADCVLSWKIFTGYTPYFAADMPTPIPLSATVEA